MHFSSRMIFSFPGAVLSLSPLALLLRR